MEWKLRNLTIEGRIIVSKSIWNLIHLALVNEILTSTINLLTKYKWNLYGMEKIRKLKNSTVCNDYENGELKNVVVFAKVGSLQCS